ncbi:hypothetical protein ASZ90_020130 [hydrocarbon metagenome]|uniref:Uncharacterized protein n=1 Tax=hydrocarbon metagenome TaxID=938273 RepID=A0A0W8E1J0_9ZZZZ
MALPAARPDKSGGLLAGTVASVPAEQEEARMAQAFQPRSVRVPAPEQVRAVAAGPPMVGLKMLRYC